MISFCESTTIVKFWVIRFEPRHVEVFEEIASDLEDDVSSDTNL